MMHRLDYWGEENNGCFPMELNCGSIMVFSVVQRALTCSCVVCCDWSLAGFLMCVNLYLSHHYVVLTDIFQHFVRGIYQKAFLSEIGISFVAEAGLFRELFSL